MNKTLQVALCAAGSIVTAQLTAGELYEAENARLASCSIENHDVGFSGSGYLESDSEQNGALKWRISSDTVGEYYLSFRYSLDGEKEIVDLAVNGKALSDSMRLKPTRIWKWKTIKAFLRKGRNTVRMVMPGNSRLKVDCFYVDSRRRSNKALDEKIDVEEVIRSSNSVLGSLGRSNVDVLSFAVYQAEDAEMEGVSRASNKSGYTGDGYADYIGRDDASLLWSLNQGQSGDCFISFRYALGAKARPLQLIINDEEAEGEVPFETTGDWNTWKWTTVKASLPTGDSTLTLSALGKSGGNIDCLIISNRELTQSELDDTVQ